MKAFVQWRMCRAFWSLAAVTIVAAGCSGDGGGGSSTTPPPAAKSLALFAGSSGGYGLRDGTGANARLTFPNSLAIDREDNVYFADSRNAVIRKVAPSGVVTTISGIPHVNVTRDGPPGVATFRYPTAIAVDAQGAIYVADSEDSVIRRISPSGVVSTLAGAVGQRGSSGNQDGVGVDARFFAVEAMIVDASGNLFVLDAGYFRRVTQAGAVVSLGGFGTGQTGPLGSVNISNVTALALDQDGTILVTDKESTVRRISNLDTVTLVAGRRLQNGHVDGDAATAQLGSPTGIAVDTSRNIYFSDVLGNTIRKISPSGAVGTIAGTVNTQGSVDARGSAASFYSPYSLVVDRAGNVIVSDFNNHTLRRVSPAGDVTTLAGAAAESGTTDGIGTAARFLGLRGIAADGSGNLIVGDSGNLALPRLRKISPAAAVTTLTIAPTDNPVRLPNGVAIDTSGTIYEADGGFTLNGSALTPVRAGGLRRITTAGALSTVALSDLNYAGSVAVDGAGNVWAGVGNCAQYPSSNPPPPLELGCAGGFRRIAAGGLTTAIGWPSNTVPTGLAIDALGNAYASSSQSHVIAKITPTGSVSILAGSEGVSGSADGPAAQARFNAPRGLALDDAGNLYVADTGNSTVRKITPGGMVSTVVGLAGEDAFLPGELSAARLSVPFGVAIVGNDLFITMPYGIGVVRNRP